MSQQKQNSHNSILQVRTLRTARQSVTQLENDFVITFSGDGTPISLPPITLLLQSISGDLSNNGRVILGQAFADFLKDELTKEWEKRDDIADLTAVSANVINVQTVAALAGDLKEIETTLDTTLTFDGLADSPDTQTINDAVLKALKKMKKFLDDYLIPSGLDEFSTLESACRRSRSCRRRSRRRLRRRCRTGRPKGWVVVP